MAVENNGFSFFNNFEGKVANMKDDLFQNEDGSFDNFFFIVS